MEAALHPRSDSSSSSGSESEESNSESESEEEDPSLDVHFRLLGRIGCYTSMRRQCEEELVQEELLPIVPAHLFQLAKLAGRLMDATLVKSLNESLKPCIGQLKTMMNEPQDSNDLPAMHNRIDTCMLIKVARSMIDTIDEHVQSAHIINQIVSFFPPPH